jgi:autotransporter-associated beta strand protein
LTPDLDQNYTVQSIAFSNNAGAFVITNTPGDNLAVAPAGTISNLSSSVQTFNLPVQLNGGARLASTTVGGNVVFAQPVSELVLGNGTLTNAGGTNILSATNTYTGPTYITAGALTIAPGGLLGASNYPGAISNAGTFNFNGGVPQTLAGAISGAGAFNINGGGTNNGPILTLAARSTFTGNVLITNSYVSLASNNTANGTVTSSPLGNPSTAGRIVTINNSILSFDATGGNDLGGGTSSPALGFIVNTNSVLQITSGNCVLGPVTLNGGTINIATATTSVTYEPFELGSTVTVGGGRPSLITNTLDGPYAGLNLTINAGSGNTIFNVGVTGGTGPDLVVAAPLCNSGGNVNAFNGITKSGAGTMELTDPNNSFTSSILINAGTFILGDPGVLQAGVFAQPIGNSATFVVTSAYGQTISGVISGTGSLIVSSNAGSVSPGSLTLSANNTYTGGTLVTNGASLYVTGSIASSTNLFVAGKSTLDFSGATSPVLGPSQTLAGLGTVNTPGAPGLGTSSGTIIAPSNDGTNASGTLTINGGGLSLAVGATAKFAVSATFNGANDAVAIAGGLALNGNALHIKAPSASVNLDQSADYVLITAGSITGSFATAPIWDVAPLNAAYFSVVTSGTTVTLHYNSVLPPTGSAAFSPTNSLRNSTVLLTVNATNGGNPSIASVTVDETRVGGMVVSLTPGSGNSWTTSIPIPPTVAPSTIALPVTITDNGGLVDIFGANLTVVSSTETWNGLGANQSWDTNANWLSGVAPGYLGDKLVFAGTTGLTPLLDQNYSLAGLTFSNNAGAFNITNSTGDYLTMLPSSVISNTSAAAENLNLPIQLGGAVTIRSTTTTGNLVFNQPVGEVTVGTGVLTNATGTNILNAANTYTGITVISNNSTLEIGGAGLLGAGTYPTNIVNNGSFLYTGSNSQAITGIISGTGGLTLNAPPTTSLTIGSGNGTIAANNYTYTGPTLVNSGILNMNFGNNGTSGINVSSNLTINNGGQVVALGSSALEGYTQQTPYLPVIINEGGVLTASNATIFAAHLYGVLTLNGGTLANGAVPDPTYGGWYMNNQVTVNGTNFTSTISDPYFCIGQAGGTTFNVASGGTTQTIPGVDLDVSGVINGTFTGSPDTGLIKTGAGSMRLDSQNTYVHATTINAGIINLNAPESAGVSGPLGTSAASNPGSIIFGGGILQYSAQNQYDYSGRFSTNAAQAIKIDTAGQSVTFATALTSSTGSLTKLGAGTLTLNNGANTYAGSTTVSNGTLTLASGTTIANSTNLSIAAGGTLNVTAVSPFTLGATSSVTASGNATPATLAASGTVSFGSRPITINYDGSHPALTIASGGTLSLNGNAFTVNGTALSPNTYTLIQQASGNVSSSGTYTVAGSAIGAHTAGSIVVNGGLVQLVVVSTYPTVGTNLVFTVTGHSVNFSWPASYLGSSLQSNSIAIAVPADWFTIAGSTTNTNVTVPIGTNANVFYRLNTP